MPVGWAAGIAAVGTVAAGAIQADAAKDAAGIQARGARDASAVQQHMFDVSSARQSPFVNSGYGANDALTRLLGLAPQGAGSSMGAPSPTWDSSNGRLVGNEYLSPDTETVDKGNGWYEVNQGGQRVGTLRPGGANGQFEHDTNNPLAMPSTGPVAGADAQGYAGDNTGLPTGYLSQTFGPEQFKAGMDPGYQWRLQQGNQGTMNSAAAGSGALSGPALKALMDYNQGAASQEYGASFDRFQTQQGNIFQRLTSLAQLGQNAAANVGAQGVQTGANIGANIVGGANAGAAGRIGAANAYAGAASDLGSLGYLYANRPKAA